MAGRGIVVRIDLGRASFTVELGTDRRWTAVEALPPELKVAAETRLAALNVLFGSGWRRPALTYEPDDLWAQARAAIEDLGGEIVADHRPPPRPLPPGAIP